MVSNYEFEKLLLLNFDCTYLMDCFYCFHDLDSRRKTPVRIAKIRIRAGNRPLTVAAAARGGPARPHGRRSSGSEAESVRQSVQPRPDPNGSLALSVAHWPLHHWYHGLPVTEMITVTVTAACQ